MHNTAIVGIGIILYCIGMYEYTYIIYDIYTHIVYLQKITMKFTDDFKSPKLCVMEKIYLQLQLLKRMLHSIVEVERFVGY